MRRLALIVFVLGLLIMGLIGTGTYMLFAWPGYLVVGVSGVLGVFVWLRSGRSGANDVCILSALLLVGYLVARAWTSPVVYLAREDMLLVLFCLMIYAAVAQQFTRAGERMVIVWGLLFLAMVNFIIGLYHFSGHPEFGIIPGYRRTYPAGRVGGLFNNPNHMGAFMSYVGLLGGAVAFYARGRVATKMCLLFAVGMTVLGLILTVSRGAYIGFAVGVVVLAGLSLWVVWYFYRKIFVRLAIGAGALSVVAAACVIYLGSAFLHQRTGESEIAVDGGRVTFWKTAVNQFALEPVVGTGSRTYYYYSRQLRAPEVKPWLGEIGHTHNDYIELLAEYGVIGLGLFTLFVVVHGVHGLGFMRWYGRNRSIEGGIKVSTRLALVIGSLAALAGGAAHAMIDFHPHIPAVAMLYAFAMGILANPGFSGPEHRPARIPGVPALLGVSATAAGIMFVYQFFFLGAGEYHLEKAVKNRDDRFNLENTVYLNKAKQLDPDNHRIYFTSGAGWLEGMREDMPSSLKESMLRKAAAEFEEARRLFPQDIYILTALGNCLDGLGANDVAEERFLEALEWGPSFQSTRLAYAVHLHRMGRFDEAEEAYSLALQANPYVSVQTSREQIPAYRKRLAEDRERMEKAKATEDAEGPVPPSE
jgi:O-antigen ligase